MKISNDIQFPTRENMTDFGNEAEAPILMWKFFHYSRDNKAITSDHRVGGLPTYWALNETISLPVGDGWDDIQCCHYGLHGSPTVLEAYFYLGTSCLGLVECSGKRDYEASDCRKAAFQTMKVVGLWYVSPEMCEKYLNRPYHFEVNPEFYSQLREMEMIDWSIPEQEVTEETLADYYSLNLPDDLEEEEEDEEEEDEDEYVEQEEATQEQIDLWRWKFLHYVKGEGIFSRLGYLNETKWELGKWNEVTGTIIPCYNGFHCSANISDAREYVQGNVLARVEGAGVIVEEGDKAVFQRMRIVEYWIVDENDADLPYENDEDGWQEYVESHTSQKITAGE